MTTRPHAIERIALPDSRRVVDDVVADEEPLEIQVQGVSVAAVMRTPDRAHDGLHDLELATGFLVAERVIASVDDLVQLEHCDVVPSPEAEGNVVRARLRDGLVLDVDRLRRHTFASSSCGICGKATLDNALSCAPRIDDDTRVRADVLCALPEVLRAAQTGYAHSGGLHAAGLFTSTGELVFAREDVGRHNAVDKVVGAMLRARIAPHGHVLVVSGRVAFELVQKCAAARIPLIAGVGAPTSLAVRAGEALGVCVVGFVRAQGCNVYSEGARVIVDDTASREAP